jgi:hypothetical protein
MVFAAGVIKISAPDARIGTVIRRFPPYRWVVEMYSRSPRSSRILLVLRQLVQLRTSPITPIAVKATAMLTVECIWISVSVNSFETI